VRNAFGMSVYLKEVHIFGVVCSAHTNTNILEIGDPLGSILDIIA
jgi:hypothetical protein